MSKWRKINVNQKRKQERREWEEREGGWWTERGRETDRGRQRKTERETKTKKMTCFAIDTVQYLPSLDNNSAK